MSGIYLPVPVSAKETMSGLIIILLSNMPRTIVWWSYNIQVDHLAVDQQTGIFAVACNAQNRNECRFIVFDPSTPVPKFVHAISETCKALAWIPVERDESHTSSLRSHIVY